MGQQDIVSAEHPGKNRFADARRLTRDFCNGTTAVHANAQHYTPREGSQVNDRLREDAMLWEQRSKWTEVYSAVRAAKDASVGLVLAQPPVIGADADPAIRAFVEDVDGKGNHLMIFSREWLDETLMDGLNGVLIDVPIWPAELERNEQNRIDAHIRATWSRYVADDIVNWDFARVGSKWKLTFLMLRERSNELTGSYVIEEVERYRELRLDTRTNVVSWKLWRMKADQGSTGTPGFASDGGGTIEAKLGTPLGYIPFVLLYGQKPVTDFVCEPPMAGIAELNLGYYRTASDRRWAMHLHFAPTMKITGREPQADGTFAPVRLGVGAVVDVPVGGDMAFVSPGSEAFEPSEKELVRIAQEMGSLSLAFLARDQSAAAETATARKLEAQSGKASLGLLAHNLQDALEQLFVMTSDFLLLADRDTVEVEVKMTYDVEKLDSQTISALNSLVTANNLSLETFLVMLKNGGVLPDNVEPNEEEARIAMQRLDAEEKAADKAREQAELSASVKNFGM